MTKDNKLTLNNHFIDLSITKQEASHKEGQLYSHQLFCPDCNCACLQEKNIYVGTDSGHIHHYQVVGRIAKLIDVQRVSSSPIMHITAHQIINTLVSCQHLDGTIQIYQKNNNRSWKNKGGATLNHPIKTMAFSLSGRWLAYADRYKAYVYDLANAHEMRTLLCNTHGIEALLFNPDQTLIISGRKGPLNLKQLFFWKFITDKKPSEHTIFPDTEKIILNHDNYYASDNAFTNRKWVDQVANQILFKLVLDNIHTTEEFDRFKKYKDTLHCGEQPLFKIIAILNKTHELQKAEKEASRLAYVRK